MTNEDLVGKILHGVGALGVRLEAVDPAEVAWDGSAPSTTHKVRLDNASAVMGHDVYAHIEVVLTGRMVRSQRVGSGVGGGGEPSIPPYMVVGLKCRFRFTYMSDASNVWHAGVLV